MGDSTSTGSDGEAGGTSGPRAEILDDISVLMPGPIPPQSDPMTKRRWIGGAIAGAVILLFALSSVITAGSSLPEPVEAMYLFAATQAGAVQVTVGDELGLAAPLDNASQWAVVSVAVDNGQQQPRLWVAKTAAPVFGEGRDTEERVVFRNRAKPPAGQHAYFVIHSFQPLADLPNRVARWEQDIRKDGPNFDDVLRALTAKIEASAGPLKWRVANPLRFEILEPVPPPEQEPSQ